ncbi:histone-lysine N-methyltransferase Set8 [Culicoides brevitarsis]|uniref:histone-lysine N-methyltransferase Set8 n=1 Tax=Culicoides brevitarsis TaxID=469753 RepID=UPI00307C3690
MIRTRKCRENPKITTDFDDVASPKRKDMKTCNVKIEMVFDKKTDSVYKKTTRNKRETRTVEVTSPNIKDFFKLQEPDLTKLSDNAYESENFSTPQKISLQTTNAKHNTVEKRISPAKKYHSPSKPLTPHRIVCISPEKNGTEILEQTVNVNDHKRNSRNKKRLDMTSRENSSDELSSVAATTLEDKKKVLNSSANPSARQNTRNNKAKQDNATKKLTDFFPIRRSVRKTNKEVQQELMRSYEKAIIEQSEDGLEVKTFENKGRGIVASRTFRKNEFVLEYVGELISIAEANKRETQYAKDENTGCYMYYFKYSEQQFCIDATEETGRLGRLVNHSRNGNLVTKTVAVKGQPHLILVAKNDINPGVELTYDYGDRSKESLTHHPWLAY